MAEPATQAAVRDTMRHHHHYCGGPAASMSAMQTEQERISAEHSPSQAAVISLVLGHGIASAVAVDQECTKVTSIQPASEADGEAEGGLRPAQAPLCAELLGDATLRTMAGVSVPELRLTGQAIKLQYNEGALCLCCMMSVLAAQGHAHVGSRCHGGQTTNVHIWAAM